MTADKLILREEKDFIQRLERVLIKLANEGIGFNLPMVVTNYIADTESNLSFIKSKVKNCAKEGIENGDGLSLFKIRRVRVAAEVKGRATTHDDDPVQVRHRAPSNLPHHQSTICHKIVHRRIRQSSELRSSAYKQSPSGYTVARLVGTTDIPSNRKKLASPAPSTRDEPSGSSLGERYKSQVNSNQSQIKFAFSTIKIKPTTSIKISADQPTVDHSLNPITRDYRSVLIEEPPTSVIQDKQLVVDDTFYQTKTSVFDRLGTKGFSSQVEHREDHKRSNHEPQGPSKRRTIDLSIQKPIKNI